MTPVCTLARHMYAQFIEGRGFLNDMELSKWTPKVAALGIVGSAITVLFMISVTKFWRHEFRSATWYLVPGVALTLIFFRKRKIAFAIIGLSFTCVNVGLTALFHPTPAGVLITLGSILGMCVLAVWGARKYPHLRGRDWKTLFDRDPEPAPRVDERPG